MGTVNTDVTLTEPITIENHGAPGTFGVTSREPAQSLSVSVTFTPHAQSSHPAGSETVVLQHPGDTCAWDLADVDSIVIAAGDNLTAGSYPAHALINFTTLPILLTSAPYVAGGPGTYYPPGTPPRDRPTPIPVVVNPAVPCVLRGSGAPSSPPTGGTTIYLDTISGDYYVWNGSTWVGPYVLGGGDVLNSIDMLEWSESGGGNTYPVGDFTITVLAGESLLLGMWSDDSQFSGGTFQFTFDGTPIDPLPLPTGHAAAGPLPINFSSAIAAPSAGSHTVGIVWTSGSLDEQGAIVVYHVKSASLNIQGGFV